jgi:hypothetical protein
LEKGFIFTESAGKTNNRHLAVAAYNKHRRDDFTKQHGLDTNEKLESFQRRTISRLTGEIESKRTNHRDAENMVFSSEHIQSRLTDFREIERLRSVLGELGVCDTQIIIYLRRPADIANSLYSTAIKTGSVMTSPPPPSAPYWNNICNHRQTLERFSSVFGESSVLPRLFDKQSFVNGSVIDDILCAIGIPRDNYEIPGNANETLSPLGIAILRRLNRTVPRWIDDKPNGLRANLVAYFVKHFSDRKYTMPAGMYEAYDVEFLESNEWVRQRYFPERESLFATDIPAGEHRDMTDSEIDSVAELIASIWNDKQREIRDLTDQGVGVVDPLAIKGTGDQVL